MPRFRPTPAPCQPNRFYFFLCFAFAFCSLAGWAQSQTRSRWVGTFATRRAMRLHWAWYAGAEDAGEENVCIAEFAFVVAPPVSALPRLARMFGQLVRRGVGELLARCVTY